MFVWRNAANEIIAYGETPFVIPPGDIQEEVGATITDYAARFVIDTPATDPVAGGTITIAVSSNTGAPSITIRIEVLSIATGELIQTDTHNVSMSDGQGSFTLSIDAPALLRLTPDNRTLFAPGGNGTLMILVRGI